MMPSYRGYSGACSFTGNIKQLHSAEMAAHRPHVTQHVPVHRMMYELPSMRKMCVREMVCSAEAQLTSRIGPNCPEADERSYLHCR